MELLNQLDGFDVLGKVKMIMATNRPDVLDPALLRPGRLDRKIEIPLPNEAARVEILKIHAQGVAKHGEVDYDAIVKLAEGMNGADMRNICTEAGMFAIRDERDYTVHEDFVKGVRKMLEAKKLEPSAEARGGGGGWGERERESGLASTPFAHARGCVPSPRGTRKHSTPARGSRRRGREPACCGWAGRGLGGRHGWGGARDSGVGAGTLARSLCVCVCVCVCCGIASRARARATRRHARRHPLRGSPARCPLGPPPPRPLPPSRRPNEYSSAAP